MQQSPNIKESFQQIGKTEREQAEVLGMSIRTVRNYKAERWPQQIKQFENAPFILRDIADILEAKARLAEILVQPETPTVTE